MQTDNFIKNETHYNRKVGARINFTGLRKLILEIQEGLLSDPELIDDRIEDISKSNINQLRHLEDVIKKSKTLIYDNSNYRKYQLRHKIIRIQNEFEFTEKNKNKYQKLTEREIEIIRLIAIGYNNPNIAEELFISRHTVEKHRKNINYKLNIKSFPHLMRYVYAFDLV